MYIYAVITVFFLSAFNIILKLLPERVHYFYSLPLITIGGLITTIIGLLLAKQIGSNNLKLTQEGVWFAIAMGLLWGIGQTASFHLFYKVPTLSIITPVIVGGIALTGALTGFFIFKEPMSAWKIVGIASILLGVFLISK